MKREKIVQIAHYRKKKKNRRKRDSLNAGKKGRVYSRGGKLWVDFRYLGERVRERSGLKDNQPNRIRVRKQLDLITAQIETGNSKILQSAIYNLQS